MLAATSDKIWEPNASFNKLLQVRRDINEGLSDKLGFSPIKLPWPKCESADGRLGAECGFQKRCAWNLQQLTLNIADIHFLAEAAGMGHSANTAKFYPKRAASSNLAPARILIRTHRQAPPRRSLAQASRRQRCRAQSILANIASASEGQRPPIFRARSLGTIARRLAV